MNSIEINIGNQKYVLRGSDSEEHLREVAELVKRKVESIKKKSGNLTLQKAAMLAAFDFASDTIKYKKKAVDYRSAILSKAGELLAKVERELESSTRFQ
jgi:cell division protein ZapA